MLGIMFEDLRNTGEDHWCPSNGKAPATEPSAINLDDEEDDDDGDASEAEEVTPTSAKGKRGRDLEKTKGKRHKTAGGHWFKDQIGVLVQMSERTTTSCESVARKEDNYSCSIKNVMELVKNCGAISGTNEHFIASVVFTKSAERDMFMTLDTAAERFEWLKKKHEWITRNDVPK